MSYDPGHPLESPYGVPPSATVPLSLGDAIKQLPAQYWRAVSRPSAATFAEEKGKAAWNIIWVQLLALAIFSAIISILIFNFYIPTIMGMFMNTSTLGSSASPQAALQVLQVQHQMIALMQAISIPVSLSYIIFVPLGFFIGLGILHLIAKAFGGQGTFVQYGYSYLLFGVPIAVVASLLSLIPILGGFVAFVLSIYHIVLQVFMTMGVHRLSGGKSTLVVLLPFIIIIVLSIVLSIAIVGAIVGAAMHR